MVVPARAPHPARRSHWYKQFFALKKSKNMSYEKARMLEKTAKAFYIKNDPFRLEFDTHQNILSRKKNIFTKDDILGM